MKKLNFLLAAVITFAAGKTFAQDDIHTLFRRAHHQGGYGAISNKFTQIGSSYANLVELYGGWYINRNFLLGAGASASTNYIPVPLEFSADPARDLSYQYGQVGLMTEYVFGSNKTVHLAFQLFSGAGFTLQYERYNPHDYPYSGYANQVYDENWFFVAEPGAQLEVNVFRWMRFSPGVSYRAAFGSRGMGVDDADLRQWSYNATLKFGKF